MLHCVGYLRYPISASAVQDPGHGSSCPALCCRERAVPAIACPAPSSVLHLLILFHVRDPLLFPSHTDFFCSNFILFPCLRNPHLPLPNPQAIDPPSPPSDTPPLAQPLRKHPPALLPPLNESLLSHPDLPVQERKKRKPR